MGEVFAAIEFAKIITEVIVSLCEYSIAVKDARDDIRKLTQELFALKAVLDYFDVYHKADDEDAPEQTHVCKMLALTQESVAAIQSKLGQPRSGLDKVVKRLTWPFQSGDIDKHLGAIERAKTWFILVMLRNSTDVTSTVFDEVKRLAAAVHEDIIDRQTAKMQTETSALLAWLAPVDAKELLHKATQFKIPDTGRWMFDKSFTAWCEPGRIKQPFMWITGKSGSGKTVLFSTVVDELRQICDTTPSSSSAVAFHCCSLDDAASQQLSNIFGSILAQSGSKRPEILQRVAPYKNKSSSLIPQNNLTSMQITECMDYVLKPYEKFYLLVDALNETPDAEQLIEMLVSLCDTHPQLRVLVTCTKDPFPTSSVIFNRRMSGGAVDHDIEAYSAHRLSSESCFRALKPNLKQEILHAIASGADGMFRWAKLCLDHLSILRTPRDIRDALRNLPATLNDTYVSILNRIPDYDREIARETLLWLCFSLRPLKLEELAEAVVFRESDKYIDDDYRLTNPTALIDICQGLVTCDLAFVTLAHDSIRSFVTSPHIRETSAAYFSLDPSTAHRRLMRKCLAYLSIEDFASGPVSNMAAYTERLGAHPLVAYATTYWPIHSERFSLTPEDEALAMSFFATKSLDNGSCFDSWVQLLLDDVSFRSIKNTQPLYYAASFNMVSILKLLLRQKEGVDLNQPGGRFGSTPLFNAVWRKNVEATRLLLEAGADPDRVDEGLTPPVTPRQLANWRGTGDLLAQTFEKFAVKGDSSGETRQV